MRLFSRRTLRDFWEERFPETEAALRTWVRTVEAARWKSWTDVKRVYGTASILKSGRIVFNIGGNKFRMVVSFVFASKRGNGSAYVRFIGTHEEYDEVDANEV